jgi:hypothetical protein
VFPLEGPFRECCTVQGMVIVRFKNREESPLLAVAVHIHRTGLERINDV